MKLQKLFTQKFALPELLGVDSRAEESRNTLAMALVAVKAISTPAEQESAVAAARDAQTYVKDVEAVGLAFRRPANAFVALCKSTEDDHVAPLKAEIKRINALVNQFQDAEDKRVAEAERKRQEEIQKAEQARIKAEQEAADAARKAAESGTKKDLKAAEKLDLKAQAAEESVRAVIVAPEPQAFKAAGQSRKQVVRRVVTDEKALFQARPDLFKVEVRQAALNAVMFPNSTEATKDKPDETVPGLKMWFEWESNVRRW